MGNRTGAARGDNLYAVHYTIQPTTGEAIKGLIEIMAQDAREALMMVQDMNPDADLLAGESLQPDGGQVEWGEVEISED